MIVRIVSDVFDVVDDEGIAEGMLGKEDDLCASSRECSYCCFTYTTCTALDVISSILRIRMSSSNAYCHQNHFSMHIPLAQIAGTGKEGLQQVQQTQPWCSLDQRPEIWHRADAIKESL